MYGDPTLSGSGNGPEFTSRAMIRWARALGIQLDFIDPGRPIQNGHVESLNDKFRDECLSQTRFIDLDDAAQTIEAWRVDYKHAVRTARLGTSRPRRSWTDSMRVNSVMSCEISP